MGVLLLLGQGCGSIDRVELQDAEVAQVEASSPAGVAPGPVLAMAKGGGRAWFATARGVSQFDAKSATWRELASVAGMPATVTALAADEQRALWVGSVNGLGRLAADGTALAPVLDEGRPVAPVNTMLLEPERPLLILGTDRGLRVLDGAAGAWSAAAEQVFPEPISSLARTADGRVWLGTPRGLFVATDLATPAVRVADQTGAPVHALLAASDGSLWVGAADGLSRVPATSGVPVTQTVKGLPHASVLSLAEDARGAIWFGTWRGLARWSPQEGRTTTVALPTGGESPVPALLVGAGGNLWVGTREGLYEGGVDTPWEDRTQAAPPQAAAQVRALALDPGGTLWVATVGDGLRRIDTKTGAWRAGGPDAGVRFDDLRALVPGRAGEVWVVTSEGATRLGDSAGTFPFEDPTDAAGAVWAASDGAGSLLVVSASGAARHLELPGGTWRDATLAPRGLRVTSIATTRGGVVFAATQDGLRRWDPTGGRWVRGPAAKASEDEALSPYTLLAPWGTGLAAATVSGDIFRLGPDGTWQANVGRGPRAPTLLATAGDEVRVVADGVYVLRLAEPAEHPTGVPADIRALVGDGAGGWWYGTPEGLYHESAKAGTAAAALGRLGPQIGIRRDGELVTANGFFVSTRGELLGSPEQRHVSATSASGASFPEGASYSVVATDPCGATWFGTQLSGVVVERAGGSLWIRDEDGLPTNDIVAIRPESNGDGCGAWVLTSSGAVRAQVEWPDRGPARLTRLAPLDPAVLQAPADRAASAVAPLADGGAILAYSGVDDPENAKAAVLIRVDAAGRGTPVPFDEAAAATFERQQVTAVAATTERIWVVMDQVLWTTPLNGIAPLRPLDSKELTAAGWSAVAVPPDEPEGV